MKKSLLIVAFLLPSLTFAQTVPFDTNLTYGSTGSTVLQLQEFLTEQGVYHGPITGNFYSLTLAGVKAFQTLEGVTPVSGFFGPITRGVANSILAQKLTIQEENNATTTQNPIDLAPTTTIATPYYTYYPPITSPAPTFTGTNSTSTNPIPPASKARIVILDLSPWGEKSFFNEMFFASTTEYDPSFEYLDTSTGVDMYKTLEGLMPSPLPMFSYTLIGVICYDEMGNPVSVPNAVSVTATDSSQNKTIGGTGILKHYPLDAVNGLNTYVGQSYYPYQYNFYTSGTHVLTFTCGTITQALTLNAQ